MSVIGDDRSSRVITNTFELPTRKFIFNKPVPIIDGKIKFYAKAFNCIIEVAVRQIKTRRGSYTADKMKRPSLAHLEIITYLYEESLIHGVYNFKPEKIFKHVNKWLRKNKKKTRKSSNGFVGRCSELARKRILEPREYSQYRLNLARAVEVLNKMEF